MAASWGLTQPPQCTPHGSRRPPAREDTDQGNEVRGWPWGTRNLSLGGCGVVCTPGFLCALQAVGHLEGSRRTSDQDTEGEDQAVWRPEGRWGRARQGPGDQRPTSSTPDRPQLVATWSPSEFRNTGAGATQAHPVGRRGQSYASSLPCSPQVPRALSSLELSAVGSCWRQPCSWP